MRACPICKSSSRRVVMNDYGGQSSINAGLGGLGLVLCLFECPDCGFRYVDAKNISQAWFDDYYLHRYHTDDAPYSSQRLYELSQFIAHHQPSNVLDIGGTDRELTSRLYQLHKIMADPLGIGMKVHGQYGAAVLSHTLEHIYDLEEFFIRLRGYLLPGGGLFIEGPLHPEHYLPPEQYDHHWQHVNKFRLKDISALLQSHGFKLLSLEQIQDYREYKCLRALSILD